MAHFAVIYNKKKSIRSNAEKIIKDLRKKGHALTAPQSKKTEFLLVLGGDGTILHATPIAEKHNLPILAVCLGRIGFLTELLPKEIDTAIKKFENKKYTLDTRKLICAVIIRHKRIVRTTYALNDAVVNSAKLARIVTIDTFAGSRKTTYRADGVIVSTATGSTAYNLSAGGTVLPPNKKELIITPICPHQVNWKSQLVSPSEEIRLVIHFPKKQAMLLTLDGQKHYPLKDKDEIIIRCQDKKVDFIRFKPYNFKKLLKLKLSGK